MIDEVRCLVDMADVVDGDVVCGEGEDDDEVGLHDDVGRFEMMHRKEI